MFKLSENQPFAAKKKVPEKRVVFRKVIQGDLFVGWLSDPLKGLSDLQRLGMKRSRIESPGW